MKVKIINRECEVCCQGCFAACERKARWSAALDHRANYRLFNLTDLNGDKNERGNSSKRTITDPVGIWLPLK